MELQLEEATPRGMADSLDGGRRLAHLGLCRALPDGRTDGWVGVESIHPSIHPTVQPTQRGPRRNHPTENLMSFTLLSIRRRVHMPCVRDAATFSCRHRPAACRPCPPPCPVLSSPVPPAGPSRLQSSPPPAASFSGARPQKLADRAAMVGSSVLYGMDGRSARPKGKAKVNGSRTVGHGTAHLCSPALRLLLLLPPPPPAHGRTLLRSFHPFLPQRFVSSTATNDASVCIASHTHYEFLVSVSNTLHQLNYGRLRSGLPAVHVRHRGKIYTCPVRMFYVQSSVACAIGIIVVQRS
jgi:hypothetical protein